jgi:hypothetical protein
MSNESPIVREVRERAMKIEERFGYDAHAYCEYLREQEKKHPERVVNQVTVVRSQDHWEPADISP